MKDEIIGLVTVVVFFGGVVFLAIKDRNLEEEAWQAGFTSQAAWEYACEVKARKESTTPEDVPSLVEWAAAHPYDFDHDRPPAHSSRPAKVAMAVRDKLEECRSEADESRYKIVLEHISSGTPFTKTEKEEWGNEIAAAREEQAVMQKQQ